ncbi:YeeE/YedE family protein [Parafilimonas sp.]|uniref:YeeE/YedE family protein n=1 Tax=Parafilimonas sp. TaxID=1969739 RepID=UPI003F80C527
MIEALKQPWPWYVSGVIIGLMVPVLLIAGNKSFGISANLRHICAACFPAKIPFFQYKWKKEIWNLFFAAGIVGGGFIAAHFLTDTNSVQVSPALMAELNNYNIHDTSSLLPAELFSWPALFSVRGFMLLIVGGFFVGFGTRYAGGCTSGHSIMGLSNLQWPSLVATISFMAGGFIMANLILPYILSL